MQNDRNDESQKAPHDESQKATARAPSIDVGEALGRAAGLGLAPLALVTAAVRDARVFHPRGLVYRADVVAPREGASGLPEAAAKLSERLAGPALVRVSSGWWKTRREWPDVLGVAVRFRRSAAVGAETEVGDQDLLFVSAPSLWRLPIAPLVTDVHDYLHNEYWAISAYQVEGLGKVKLALKPKTVPERAGTRAEKLDAAVAEANAVLHLWVRTADGRSAPIADIDLVEHVNVDQEKLRFSPFHAGRGLDPVGFVHGLRWATYAASRLGERAADRAREAQQHTAREGHTPDHHEQSRGSGISSN